MEYKQRRYQRDSWEYLADMASLPAVPVPFTGLAANQQLFTGRCIYLGATYHNTATTAAQLAFYDGLDNTGAAIFNGFPSASQWSNQWFGQPGILCQRGIFAVVGAASFNLSIFIVPLDHYDNMPPPG